MTKKSMLRTFFLAWLLSAFSSLSHAQLFIDGREVFFDETTHLWVATIPEALFGNSCKLSVSTDNTWNQVTIDGQQADSTCLFYRLSPDKMYATILRNDKGQVLAGFLSFTSLPTMRLQGRFGYDYSPAVITIANPTEKTTFQSDARCKWRGGSTNAAGKHKRNYKIEFAKDTQLFQLRKDDKWLLDAGQMDVFRLRNHIATKLWNDMGTRPYYAETERNARLGVRGRVVELFLNNRYWGIYSLTENMDRKLTKVRKCSNGEIHGCLWKAKSYENTQMHNISGPYDNRKERWGGFEVKYPDLNDNDTTDWSVLYNAVSFVINSSQEQFRQHVADYFDLPVLADFYLLVNALAAIDNHGKNMLWAVYDKQNDKRITPIPWDMDCTVGQPWAEKISPQYVSPYYPLHNAIRLIDRLLSTNACKFTKTTVERYYQLRQGCLNTDSLIARYEHYYRLLVNSGAAQRERQRWSGDSDIDGSTIDFDQQIAYISDWIRKRMAYMDNRMNSVARLSIAATTVKASEKESIYTLSGTKKPGTKQSLRPGIYITKGRKILVR